MLNNFQNNFLCNTKLEHNEQNGTYDSYHLHHKIPRTMQSTTINELHNFVDLVGYEEKYQISSY